MPDDLAEEMWNSMIARANLVIQFLAQTNDLSLNAKELELIDVGIAAGITATLEELRDRDQLAL